MSKSEDYLDDLLNSVSDVNRRNNKKDIENLIQSMNEEAAKPRAQDSSVNLNRSWQQEQQMISCRNSKWN